MYRFIQYSSTTYYLRVVIFIDMHVRTENDIRLLCRLWADLQESRSTVSVRSNSLHWKDAFKLSHVV
jgi:hypothetical protein